MADTVRTINSLMAYLRDRKNIDIRGSSHKRKLRNMGYYHGYKGYRFAGEASNALRYSNFDELYAVYQFDLALKGLLYPKIMFIETALKNYALEILLQQTNSSSFSKLYNKELKSYKSYPVNSKKYNDEIRKRNNLQTKIYGDLARSYGKSRIVSHFYDRDRPVPIWALFELLTFGEFGMLLSCLNPETKVKISNALSFNSALDADGKTPVLITYALRDLRNAIAHNDPIFDTRFRSRELPDRLKNYMQAECGIPNIRFNTIADYFLLVAYMMQRFHCTKTEIRQFLNEFLNCIDVYRSQIPASVFTKFIHTDTRSKINRMIANL